MKIKNDVTKIKNITYVCISIINESSNNTGKFNDVSIDSKNIEDAYHLYSLTIMYMSMVSAII